MGSSAPDFNGLYLANPVRVDLVLQKTNDIKGFRPDVKWIVQNLTLVKYLLGPVKTYILRGTPRTYASKTGL